MNKSSSIPKRREMIHNLHIILHIMHDAGFIHYFCCIGRPAKDGPQISSSICSLWDRDEDRRQSDDNSQLRAQTQEAAFRMYGFNRKPKDGSECSTKMQTPPLRKLLGCYLKRLVSGLLNIAEYSGY